MVEPLVVELFEKRFEILERAAFLEQEMDGKPYYFRLDIWIAAIKMMIASDEIQSAIWMCDNPPGWFRENYPKELQEIKDTLYKNHYDIFEYANDDDEASMTRDVAEDQWFSQYCYPRATIITDEIKRLNDSGKIPWIFDLSCSHGNLPMGLLKANVKFTYLGKSMNHRAAKKLKEWVGKTWADQPEKNQETILVCTESLEHAWDPQDIVRAAYKMDTKYDQIFFSTPLNTLFQGLPNFESRRLGHIRTWTGEEFRKFMIDNWPGYTWEYFKSFSQVIHGKMIK